MASTVRCDVEDYLLEAGVRMLRYRIHASPKKAKKHEAPRNTKLTNGKSTPAR